MAHISEYLCHKQEIPPLYFEETHPQGIHVIWLLLACTDQTKDNAELPPEEEYSEEESIEPSFEEPPVSEEAFDEAPPQMLQLVHTGIWNLSPIAGPYTSLYGELNIQERIDGGILFPYCDFDFAVTGYKVETLCPTCDFGFSIEFFVQEPEPVPEEEEIEIPDGIPIAVSIEECFTPELPEHQETRTLAYSIDEQMLYFDYFNTGIWVPWYPATFINDTLEVYYYEEVGFYGVEND